MGRTGRLRSVALVPTHPLEETKPFAFRTEDGAPVPVGPQPEEFADLVYAVSLLWRAVEEVTARLDALECVREVAVEVVDLVS